jgi:RHS repeat-associated protein
VPASFRVDLAPDRAEVGLISFEQFSRRKFLENLAFPHSIHPPTGIPYLGSPAVAATMGGTYAYRRRKAWITMEGTFAKVVGFVVLVSLVLVVSRAAMAQASGYAFERAIVINHSQIPNADQSNFPVLVSGTFPDLATVGNGGNVQSAQGYDIIFTSDSAGQNHLDHEIDTYNSATGAVNFWVRIPSVSHTTDSTIYMWYGNNAVTVSQENKPGVWSNGYAAVYHMGNGAAISGSDSTANNPGTVSSVSAAAGVIGGAGTFSGSSSITAIPLTPLSGSFTVEQWVNPSSNTVNGGLFGSRTPSDESFDTQLYSGGLWDDIGNGTSWLNTSASASFPYSANTWHHFVHTVTTNSYRIYSDGRQVGSGTFSGTPLLFDASHHLVIGNTGYPAAGLSGLIDETRVSTVVRSADWITAEYNNQSSPATFAVPCPAQAAGSPMSNCLRPATTTYSYIRAINLNHAQVANSDQQDFPVLISGTYPELADTANGGKVQSPQGYDIIFTSDAAGQNQLDHEIDTYDPATGAVNFWVKIPTLSHTNDTTIYMWYGNSAVTVSQESKAGVWSNGYAAVYHMGNGTAVAGIDSVGANSGTVTSVSSVIGIIGGAGNFNGNGSVIAKPTGPLSGSFTVEQWVKPTSGSPFGSRQPSDQSFDTKPYSAGIWDDIGNGPSWIDTSANAVFPWSPNVWHHFVHSVTTNSYQIYADGKQVGSGTFTGTPLLFDPNHYLLIGESGYPNEGFYGSIDETRISSVLRSADWIATEFNTQSAPSAFAMLCPEQAVGTTISPCSPNPSATTYGYSRAVTLNHSLVANSDQLNFPVLISGTYPDLANVANGGNVRSPQGYDIIFTSDSAGQNRLDHEIDTYSPSNGAINLWVRIPLLSHTTDTTIYMWYGNAAVSVSQENKPGVWSNGYAAVYHLGNGTSTTAVDSTGANSGEIGASAISSQIGGGISVDGSGSQYMLLPDSSSLKPTAALTLEAWVNPISVGSWNKVFSVDYHANGGWSSPFQAYSLSTVGTASNPAFQVSNNATIYYAAAGTVLPLSRWSHLVGTFDGQTSHIFVNGVEDPTGVPVPGNIDYGTSKAVVVGKDSIYSNASDAWNGRLDELRVSNVARSADWVATEYNNQNSPQTFVSITGEAPAVTAPKIETISPTVTAIGAQITITGSNFGATQQSGSVVLNNTLGTIVSWADAHIVVAVPQGTSPGNLYVQQNALNSNAVPFTWNTPYVANVSPENGARAVSPNSSIILSFNEAIDPSTVNSGTLPISVTGISGVLSGGYSVDSTGKVLTFSPGSPFPGNATVNIQVASNGIADLAGNHLSSAFVSSFATGAATDTSPPQVVSITPNSGTAAVSTNSTVVLAFSESINPATVTASSVGMIANGVRLGAGISISADDRTVTLNAFGLPGDSVIGVFATSGITDWSGNALVNFQSQFTTGVTDSQHPSVVAERPGSGATGVPVSASLVIYFNEPMNASSIQGAVHVTQNGTVINGTTVSTEDGQVATFTPSAPFPAGQNIQISVDATALDLDGNTLYAYQGSFRTAADTSTEALQFIAANPADGPTPIPTNALIDVKFNEPIDPITLTDTSVQCYQNSGWIQTALILVGDGSQLQILPRFPLAPNAAIRCVFSTPLAGTNGLQFTGYILDYRTGTGPDTTRPTVVSVSPPNGWTNVGDNGYVRLIFSEPIDPLTLNSNTVVLSGAGITVVPDSISFTNNNQSVMIVPHAPLPDSTVMTVTINGVTDSAGNAVVPQTTRFTTGANPDFSSPVVVAVNPSPGAVNVPTNAIISVQLSEPIDPTTVTGSGINLDYNGTNLPGAYSVSADGQTINFLPNAPLSPNSYMEATFGNGITDLAGNPCCSGSWHTTFQTRAGPSATAPQVQQVVPASGATAIPTNSQIMIQFNEPVDAAKLQGIVLNGGGSVNTTQVLSNGNQTLNLIPLAPLTPSITYTLSVSGIEDLSGNIQAVPFTSTFVTAPGADLNLPKAISVTPGGNVTGISINTPIQVQFNKPINPLTITSATFQVYPASTRILISGTIAVSMDGFTATFTPTYPLAESSTYVANLTSAITDLEGQGLQGLAYNQGVFTTAQTSSGLAPNIQSLPWGNGGNIGNTVILDGSYFGITQGSSTVTFNGVPGTILEWTDTQIETQVPSGATSGPLLVIVNGIGSNPVTFIVIATPNVTGVSPSAAAAGTAITLTGTNLGDSYDTLTVNFTGGTATPTSVNETSVVVTVPAGASPGAQNINLNNGYGNSSIAFTVIPTPAISDISPNSGVAGGQVTISGSHLGSTQGSSLVYFNGVPAATIVSWQDGRITAVPPANVTTGPVTVVEGGIASNSSLVFTVVGPAIGSLSPPNAAPGAVVAIKGSNLLVSNTPTQVFFNGIAAQIVPNGNGIPIISSTGFSAYVPNNATSGPVTVQIGNVTTNALNFTVEQPPTITGVSPNNGQVGAWPITITGSGFGATMSNSTLSFWDGVPAQIISWSDTEIQAMVPEDVTTGPVSVQVGVLLTSGPWFYATTPTLLTDSLGNQTTYNFGVNGGSWGLASSAGPGCSTCTIRGTVLDSTDSNGNILSHTDDLGRVTSYAYDSNSNVTSISQHLNPSTPVTTSYTYNTFGEVLTATDPLGNVTTNTYDTNGNLLTVTSPAPNGSTPASVTHFSYDTKGELTSIADPLSNPTTLAYTTTGLIASITDAQNHTTSYQYDARGNRTAVIDPINGAAHPTTFAYDVMNRLTGITYPNGSSVSFGYDYRGRRTSVTDQDQKTTTYTYDDADRLTAVTDPANNTTYYAYDTEDNLSSITDANNHTTNFAYNARGWVTQTTFPSTLYETYGYDAVGNLTSKTDRKNETIQYVYDALNRLAQKSYPDSTSVDYVYDLASKVTQVNDPTGVYGFAYDNMGRLIGTTTQYSFLPNQTFTNSYTYDAASNRKSLTAPDGSITTYGYDTLNRLNGLANSWAGSFSFGYDGLSRRTSLTRPNGVDTSYNYDSLSRLLSVLHQAGTNVLDGASYTYDAAGNRSSKTNYLNDSTSNYAYDPVYELTQVTQGGSTMESYSYDAVGNRLSSQGVPSYQYNASNELTSGSLGSYAYDNNGNTLSDATGKSYAWDFDNRLTLAIRPGTSGGTTTFKYDPFGRRIMKSGPNGVKSYLYDGINPMEELDSNGSVLARYAETDGIDEILSENRGGTISYYQQDRTNSVTSLSSLDGTLTNSFIYDSYGRLTASSGSPTNTFQFTGRDSDSETDAYYYRARYYDPIIGRFISEDPIRFAGDSSNFYAYSLNSPVNYRDPLGTCVINVYFERTGAAADGFFYHSYIVMADNTNPFVNGRGFRPVEFRGGPNPNPPSGPIIETDLNAVVVSEDHDAEYGVNILNDKCSCNEYYEILESLNASIDADSIPYNRRHNSNSVTSMAIQMMDLAPPPIPWWISLRLPGWGNGLR